MFRTVDSSLTLAFCPGQRLGACGPLAVSARVKPASLLAKRDSNGHQLRYREDSSGWGVGVSLPQQTFTSFRLPLEATVLWPLCLSLSIPAGQQGLQAGPAPWPPFPVHFLWVLPDAELQAQAFSVSAHQGGFWDFSWMPPQTQGPRKPKIPLSRGECLEDPPKWTDRHALSSGHQGPLTVATPPAPATAFLSAQPPIVLKHNSNHRPPVPAAPEA